MVSIAVVVCVSVFFLIVSILHLYREAEKVQKNIFTREVISVGNDVVDRIDRLLREDSLYHQVDTLVAVDSVGDLGRGMYQKIHKSFLVDPSRMLPVGVVNTTINYLENDVTISNSDTLFFDTTYKKMFSLNSSILESSLEDSLPKSLYVEMMKTPIDLNKIEMDSVTKMLLNRKYLNRIIREEFADENIDLDFEFGLYNSFTTQFVVISDNVNPGELLKSQYVFSLKNSDRFCTPHYLIIAFPSERIIFLHRMGVIVGLISAFFVIIIFVVIYIFYQLFRQKRIAEVKNDFINNITHEFKTPISTISLACEALSDKDMMSNEEVRSSYISIIYDENNRLKNLVNNILQLAQLKKGQLQINLEKFNINDLINHICEAFMLQIRSRKGMLTKNLDESKPIIIGDYIHIENILVNLLDNALKYSPGNPEISVSTQCGKRDLVIKISDKGMGIPKKNLKRIFDDFYRVNQGNVHDTKGYGLGLHYVKSIVKLHGGTISVESVENQGSTFIITLPYKKS